MKTRQEKFEAMLSDIQKQYHDILVKMEKLKMEDKTKTATYRQLMGNKMMYQNMLSLCELLITKVTSF